MCPPIVGRLFFWLPSLICISYTNNVSLVLFIGHVLKQTIWLQLRFKPSTPDHDQNVTIWHSRLFGYESRFNCSNLYVWFILLSNIICLLKNSCQNCNLLNLGTWKRANKTICEHLQGLWKGKGGRQAGKEVEKTKTKFYFWWRETKVGSRDCYAQFKKSAKFFCCWLAIWGWVKGEMTQL